MKRSVIIAVMLLFGFALAAQNQVLKSNIKSKKPPTNQLIYTEANKAPIAGGLNKATPLSPYKSTNVVSISNIGTSANAFGYGYNGGQRSLICAHEELDIVANIHRMGGALDPGGYSGDLGYDISQDAGINWTNMLECYTIGEPYGEFLESARFPQHGIYNPPGNTDPNEAYVVFFAATLDASNSPDSWGGYCYGRARIGDITDTSKHLKSSDPQNGIYQYIPESFTVTPTGDFWAVDFNVNLLNQPQQAWMEELIVSHGTWDDALKDYSLTQFLLPCPTQDSSGVPPCARVEFSPDGQVGYIAVIADNGSVELSMGHSFYPILWRTEDAGETWSDPIPVALAGEEGIYGVLNFLSADEIEELYEYPFPEPNEIPFTTAYDFDLSVDSDGNPQIAVVVGVTAEEPYSIITQLSQSSGYMYTAAFLLSSENMGNPGSWKAYELGRLQSFRGNFGDITEDNRIQVARDAAAQKMFVAWLDTDTTVSSENNAPDIWARGVDLVSHMTSYNIETLLDEPQNFTYGSEATFAAHFFAMADEVFYNDTLTWPTYTMPFTYENMWVMDPYQEVEFKYIQNAFFYEQQFMSGPPPPGISEDRNIIAGISSPSPNPASTYVNFELQLRKPKEVSLRIIDFMGQVVKSYPTQSFNQGKNTISLDISDFPAGIYFFNAQAETETISRKMIVQ